METDVIIVGAGLSGLNLAHHLSLQGTSFHLLEARGRVGGRILSTPSGEAFYDMGPAWFWPGQPRIAALIKKFSLQVFEQFVTGELSFEDQTGAVQRGRSFPSTSGSYRIKGGFASLIQALLHSLPPQSVTMQTTVTNIVQRKAGVQVHTNGQTYFAKHIVFALPPRIISATIKFDPALKPSLQASLSNVPTWMATQAKAIAVYDSPFWRDDGLSGEATSQFGPMVEMHDASPTTGRSFAIFGFIGVLPESRKDETKLRNALIQQLGRLFGPKATKPRELLVKDWAYDLLTSTEEDLKPLNTHPIYRQILPEWKAKIHFSGTEVAPKFGGYLEGALEAAENTVEALRATMNKV
ncbi:MAG: flavin monoamine oxidase family protein [Pseudomonadales bacterium]